MMKEMGLDPSQFEAYDDPDLADLDRQLRRQENGGDDDDFDEAELLAQLRDDENEDPVVY